MKLDIPKLLKTQAQYKLDEIRKKDWSKVSIKELKDDIGRLYDLYPPDKEHERAILTIRKRYEEMLKPIKKNHNYDKLMKETEKLGKKFKKYEVEKEELMRGYMIQEIKGFIIEKKLK